MLGGKLPARGHAWMFDDVRGRLYWLRLWLRMQVGFLGGPSVVWQITGATTNGWVPFPSVWLVGSAVALPILLLQAGVRHDNVLKQHGYNEEGAPLVWGPHPAWAPVVEASYPVAGTAAVLAVYSQPGHAGSPTPICCSGHSGWSA